MKKLIPILLALLLMVGLMPTAAFAAEEKSETFICDGNTAEVEGEHFNLSAKFGTEKGGWSGGNRIYPLTITARDNGTRITHIDAHVCYYGNLYNNIGVSCGTKVPESLGNSTTGDVSVTDINCKEFSFTNGYTTVPFNKITVYFETCEEDGHFMENGFCKICGMCCPHESEPTKTVVSAEKVSCPDCGKTLSFTEITEPENTASIISNGYPEILYGIGGLAIGFLAAAFIFRKKKAAVSDADSAEK